MAEEAPRALCFQGHRSDLMMVRSKIADRRDEFVITAHVGGHDVRIGRLEELADGTVKVRLYAQQRGTADIGYIIGRDGQCVFSRD